VGRTLRQKKEERTVQPMILDVVDFGFVECVGQWNKRRKFYVECGYALRWVGESTALDEAEKEEKEEAAKGVALFVDEDAEVAAAPAAAAAPAPKKGKGAKKKTSASEAADIISHVTRGNALFVDEED
jgi:hypothetical protein